MATKKVNQSAKKATGKSAVKPRPTDKNLRRLTTEEAREIGRIGGLKSVDARRRKKTMKEILNQLLEMKPTELEKTAIGQLFPGIDVENLTKESMILMAQIQKAIVNKDTRAATFVRDTSGNQPDVVLKGDGLTTNITPIINVSEKDVEKMIEKLK